MCSTPDGIKGFSTPLGGVPTDINVLCSTPDGIKGFSTLKVHGMDQQLW